VTASTTAERQGSPDCKPFAPHAAAANFAVASVGDAWAREAPTIVSRSSTGSEARRGGDGLANGRRPARSRHDLRRATRPRSGHGLPTPRSSLRSPRRARRACCSDEPPQLRRHSRLGEIGAGARLRARGPSSRCASPPPFLDEAAAFLRQVYSLSSRRKARRPGARHANDGQTLSALECAARGALRARHAG